MFLIPLNQPESVQLVIHALRVAGGIADCSDCPVKRVCMKQCLKIAESIQQMVDDNSLPSLFSEDEITDSAASPRAETASQVPPGSEKNSHLKIIK
jgi:hypothetical protein